MIVLGVVLVAYLLIPMIKNTTDAQAYRDSLTKVNASGVGTSENFTLTQTEMETGSLAITNLTLGPNYSIDYTTAIVTLESNTTNWTYTASYNYYEPGYLQTAGERSLMAVGVVAVIVGLLVMLFQMFGVTGKT